MNERWMSIDVAAFSAARRQWAKDFALGEQPQGVAVTTAEGGEVAPGGAEGIEDDLSTRGELPHPAGRGVLKVSVLYYPARLGHPVKKPFEIILVCWRLAVAGWHVARLMARESRRNAELAEQRHTELSRHFTLGTNCK